MNNDLRDGIEATVSNRAETAAAIPQPTPAISRTLNEGMEVVMPQLEIASENEGREMEKGNNLLVEM